MFGWREKKTEFELAGTMDVGLRFKVGFQINTGVFPSSSLASGAGYFF